MPTTRIPLRLATLPTLLLAAAAGPLAALPGLPDQVPGATLVVPYFEVGIDVGSHSHDTLMTVQNIAAFPVTIHWTVWTPSGAEATSMSGSTTIAGAGTWARGMRDMIRQTASDEDQAALVRGDFYRGFLTIDVVDEATDLNPFSQAYPYGVINVLEGFTYYLRTGEGSSNGLRMVPVESATTELDPFLINFYAANENVVFRERIDPRARLCAELLVGSGEQTECLEDAFDGTIHRIHARGFLDQRLNGETRIIVFAWNTFRPQDGGPSAICDTHAALGCASTYTLRRYDEAGDLRETREIRLDDVMTVIELTEGEIGGLVTIRDIPDPDRALQIFAFSINSAKPAGLGQNWDAIFEAVVVP